MSIGCVAIAGRPQDVVSSSGALWGHQTAETARGREWCIRYRITRLRNSVLSIANAPTGESSVLLCSPVRSVSTSGTVEIEARPPKTYFHSLWRAAGSWKLRGERERVDLHLAAARRDREAMRTD